MTFSFVYGLEVDDIKKSFINQCVGGEKVLLAIPHNLKFKSYNWITFKTPLYPPTPPPLSLTPQHQSRQVTNWYPDKFKFID